MPKKIAPKAASLLGGGKNSISSISQADIIINIPSEIIKRLEQEIQGVSFGGVSLIVAIRDGHPSYRLEKTVSILTGA